MAFPNFAHQFNEMDLLTAELVRAYFLEHPPQIGLLKEEGPDSTQWHFDELTECDFDGYQRYDLVGWTTPDLDGDEALSTADQVNWSNDGAEIEPVLGFFVVDSVDSTRILFGRNISAPPIYPGGVWGLQGQYSQDDGFPG